MEVMILKSIWEWILVNFTPSTVAIVSICVMAFRISWKLNKTIEAKDASELEQNKKIDRNAKDINKLINLISCCPCINKENATWLQNPAKNGGGPPVENIHCFYLKDKDSEEK